VYVIYDILVIVFPQGRLPFHVPEKVAWPALAQTLVTKFASHCGLGLSIDNLSYLAFKLFGQADDYSLHFVTWTQFNRVRWILKRNSNKLRFNVIYDKCT